MKVLIKNRILLVGSAGLLLTTAVLLLPGLLASFQDRPVKIRFTRFQENDAGLNVAMFEFTNSSPNDLNIRVPGADLNGRGAMGTLEFNIDGGTCTHVLVRIPTNNSRLQIRASYLTTPALVRRWKVTELLNRRFHLGLTNSDFILAPTVVGPIVECFPNLPRQ